MNTKSVVLAQHCAAPPRQRIENHDSRPPWRNIYKLMQDIILPDRAQTLQFKNDTCTP